MPFGNAFGWPHLIVILVVILLLFGAPKLPGLAKSLGQSMRIFRKEVSTMKEERADDRRPDVRVVDEDAPIASGGAGAGIPEPRPEPAPGAAAEPGSTPSRPKP
jgi:sec-independent protein translocase protein TatA